MRTSQKDDARRDRYVRSRVRSDLSPAPKIMSAPSCVPLQAPVKNFRRLANGVYRGGHPFRDDAFAMLAFLGVRTIINLEDCTSTSARSRQQERHKARVHGMKMLHFPTSPLFSLRFHRMMRAVHALEAANHRPVYVHCFFGHERTGFLVALNRFFNEGWTYEEAHAEMMACGFRPWLVPAMYHCFRRWCAKNPQRLTPKED